jgi:hypothetical protein
VLLLLLRNQLVAAASLAIMNLGGQAGQGRRPMTRAASRSPLDACYFLVAAFFPPPLLPAAAAAA